MKLEELSYEYLQEQSTPASFSRWEEYYFDHLVTSAYIIDWDLIWSIVGTDAYTAKIDKYGDWSCTCPYSHWWWCKHVIALWLCYTEESENYKKEIDLNKKLEGLTTKQLKKKIITLAKTHPEIIENI